MYNSTSHHLNIIDLTHMVMYIVTAAFHGQTVGVPRYEILQNRLIILLLVVIVGNDDKFVLRKIAKDYK